MAGTSDRVVTPRITQAVDDNVLTTLKGNTHPLARPEFDRGALAPSVPLKRMLMLLHRSSEQQAALSKLMEEQQEKGSANFHKWLTPDEFGKNYGPSDQDIRTITTWLHAHGFTVTEVSKGRTIIEFTGTAGMVQEAFHTSIHKYVINGEEHWANNRDPQIPAALTPVVAGLVSLHNFPKHSHMRKMGTFERSKDTGEIKPLFTYPQSGFTLYGVGPSDFATIYNVQPLWNAGMDGTGQTLAIVGQTNINIQDVRDFRSMWGLPANDPNIILNGPDPGIIGDETEADLDVQWSGAVAKGATIDFVVSERTELTAGIDLSALYIINNNLAPVMSESYGACEAALGTAGNQFYQFLWEQAAAQGITVMLSTGDNGSAGCDDPNTETLAQNGLGISGLVSTPFNVAVGGTDFDQFSNASNYWNATNNSTTQSSAKSYIPEIPWNDSCAGQGGTTGCPSGTDPSLVNISAGSGGVSTVYAKPTWQTGTGVPNDGARDIPDVSLFASNGFNFSFYIICESDAVGGASCNLNSPYTDFLGIGGTSASSPAFAGIMAIVNQAHGRQGNANFVLYKLAAQSGASCNSSTFPPSSSCTFYDTTKGNNSVPCTAGSANCSVPASGDGVLVDANGNPAYTTTAGYDLATGLGSVNANNLVNNWTSVSFTGTTTTLTLSPTSITHGQPVTATVTVKPSSGSGTPSGDVSLIASGAANNNGLDGFSLSGGSATFTTNILPGGSYGVTAHYAGDGTFGASDSTSPVNVTVTPENSNTLVRLQVVDQFGNVTYPTSVAYGSPYTLRFDVLNSASAFCNPAPFSQTNPPGVGCATGNITVTDNGASLDAGTYPLTSAGLAEDLTVQLAGGSHAIAGNYSGDKSYNPSSSTANFTVTAATVGINAPTLSSSSVGISQNVTISTTVTTSSSGVAPTGTVTFLSNGTAITGSVTYTPQNATSTTPASLGASLTTSFSTAGTLSITASYAGDTNYAASGTSSPATLTVSSGGSFGLSPANPASATISAGQSTTSTITVTSNGGFSSTVALTCSISPTVTPAPTCSLSPTSVTAPANGSANSTLTVGTTAASAASLLHIAGKQTSFPLYGLWLPVSGLALLGSAFGPRSRRRKLTGLILAMIVFAGLVYLIGCGGSSSSSGGNPGTPSGTYTVTVTGTSGTLAPQSTSFTLTVQ
jgi:VCBS repeat-containing protein